MPLFRAISAVVVTAKEAITRGFKNRIMKGDNRSEYRDSYDLERYLVQLLERQEL